MHFPCTVTGIKAFPTGSPPKLAEHPTLEGGLLLKAHLIFDSKDSIHAAADN
jgi:hypothetical protein